MSPAQSAMIMRKLEAMEKKNSTLSNQVRRLQNDAELERRRTSSVSGENMRLLKRVQMLETMVQELIRRGR